MFGINFWEFTVLLLVGLAVFGPDKLPDVARQLGRFVRTTRRMVNNARAELSEEIGSDLPDLNLRHLDPRKAVKDYVFDVLDEDDDEAVDDKKPGHRPLAKDETPPYDVEAT
ncbi:MAG: translocase [Propionibacteriales bacterium]|nr:translocase [Propionibacteriales bacterium]